MNGGQVVVTGRQQVKGDRQAIEAIDDMQAPAEEALFGGGTHALVRTAADLATAASPNPSADRQRQGVNQQQGLLAGEGCNHLQERLEPMSELMQPTIETGGAERCRQIAQTV